MPEPPLALTLAPASMPVRIAPSSASASWSLALAVALLAGYVIVFASGFAKAALLVSSPPPSTEQLLLTELAAPPAPRPLPHWAPAASRAAPTLALAAGLLMDALREGAVGTAGARGSHLAAAQGISLAQSLESMAPHPLLSLGRAGARPGVLLTALALAFSAMGDLQMGLVERGPEPLRWDPHASPWSRGARGRGSPQLPQGFYTAVALLAVSQALFAAGLLCLRGKVHSWRIALGALGFTLLPVALAAPLLLAVAHTEGSEGAVWQLARDLAFVTAYAVSLAATGYAAFMRVQDDGGDGGGDRGSRDSPGLEGGGLGGRVLAIAGAAAFAASDALLFASVYLHLFLAPPVAVPEIIGEMVAVAIDFVAHVCLCEAARQGLTTIQRSG